MDLNRVIMNVIGIIGIIALFIGFIIFMFQAGQRTVRGQELLPENADHIYNSETGKWEKGGALPDETKLTPPPPIGNVHIATPEEEEAMRQRDYPAPIGLEKMKQLVKEGKFGRIKLDGRKPQPAKKVNTELQYQLDDIVIYKPDKVIGKVIKIEKERENYLYWVNVIDDKGNEVHQLRPVVALGEELYRLMYFEYTGSDGKKKVEFPKDVKDNNGNWILGDGLGEDGKPLPNIKTEKNLPPIQEGIPLGHQFVILHSNWATFSNLPATYKVWNSRGKFVTKGKLNRGQAKFYLAPGRYTVQLSLGQLTRTASYEVKVRNINYMNFGGEYFKQSVQRQRETRRKK